MKQSIITGDSIWLQVDNAKSDLKEVQEAIYSLEDDDGIHHIAISILKKEKVRLESLLDGFKRTKYVKYEDPIPGPLTKSLEDIANER